jgi:hypothetical protein
MVVHDKPGLPGLSFAWKSFTPIAEHIRIRLLRSSSGTLSPASR